MAGVYMVAFSYRTRLSRCMKGFAASVVLIKLGSIQLGTVLFGGRGMDVLTLARASFRGVLTG